VEQVDVDDTEEFRLTKLPALRLLRFNNVMDGEEAIRREKRVKLSPLPLLLGS
jgi:predicted GIY-YIG superfamily endonuclease